MAAVRRAWIHFVRLHLPVSCTVLGEITEKRKGEEGVRYRRTWRVSKHYYTVCTDVDTSSKMPKIAANRRSQLVAILNYS